MALRPLYAASLRQLRQKVSLFRSGEVSCPAPLYGSPECDIPIPSQSARRALHCALDVQRAFAQRNETAEEPIRVRIGLHTGEAMKEADDFYGKNVILAARIAGEAKGGQLLVSSLLKELTESAGDIVFGEGREVELKGLAGRHRVFEVVW